MLGYMGVVSEFKNPDVNSIHENVYETLRKNTSNQVFRKLTQSPNQYRENCFDDANYFYRQLNFYRVKPMYNWMIWFFNQMGYSLLEATYLPSAIAYIGIGGLFFFWISKYLNSFYALVVSIFTLSLETISDLARLSTPDSVSTFFILCLVFSYCFYHYRWVLFFLTLCVLARIDNVVLCGVLGFLLLFDRKLKWIFIMLKDEIFNYSDNTYTKWWGGIFIVLGFLLFLIIPPLVGNTEEWIGNFNHTTSVKNYFSELFFSLNAFRYSHFQLLLILTIILLPLVKQIDFFEGKIIVIILLVMLGRLVAFPSFQDRFFIGFELLLLLVLARLVSRVRGNIFSGEI